MSSLSLTILILIVLGVGGVGLYNLWLMRRREPESHRRLLDEPNGRHEAEPTLNVADDFGDRLDPDPERRVAPNASGYLREEPVPVEDRVAASFEADADFGHRMAAATDSVRGSASNPPTDRRIDVQAWDDDVDRTDGGLAEESLTHSARIEAERLQQALGVRPAASATDEAGAGEVTDASADWPDTVGVSAAVPVTLDPPVEATDAPRVATQGDHPQVLPSRPRPEDRPVERFDCIVELFLGAEARGERILQATGGLWHVGSKPVLVRGGREQAFDEGSRTGDGFSPIVPEADYNLVQMAVLLANRHGPLTVDEYEAFAAQVQAVADAFGAIVDLPDTQVVIARARALDAELGALDAQVAINVELPRPLEPDDLPGLARRLNLHAQPRERYVRVDGQGHAIFSVGPGDLPNRILLILDVPRVARDGLPLREMVECAWKTAQSLEGRMIDDGGNPIDNALFERIESQVEMHYQALTAAGLTAGSSIARRVFT